LRIIFTVFGKNQPTSSAGRVFPGRLDSQAVNNSSDVIANTLKKLPEWQGVRLKSAVANRNTVILFSQMKDRIQVLHIDSGELLNLTIVTQKPDGTAVNPPEMYFSNYYPDKGVLTKRDNVENRCMNCHRAGLMPIALAEDGSVQSYSSKHSSAEFVDWFNNTLAPTFASANLAGNKTSNLNLPQMGEIDPPQRTEEFMRQCITSAGVTVSINRIPKVMKSMNCANCHDGDSIGKVSYIGHPTNFFADTIQTMITSGVMPPHNDLSND
jgi:hypothetical protein